MCVYFHICMYICIYTYILYIHMNVSVYLYIRLRVIPHMHTHTYFFLSTGKVTQVRGSWRVIPGKNSEKPALLSFCLVYVSHFENREFLPENF